MRKRQLRHILHEGAAWEVSTSRFINALSKKKNFRKKKRVGSRQAKEAERLQDPAELLQGEDATTFRALAARANYLALDRPDIAFTTKELCRAFASPSRASVFLLKRLVKYLVGVPRLVWHFNHQPATGLLVGSVDTDFAGCLITRRSTSGGVACRGHHLLKHWSHTQPTVSLSSGEAELGGICKGASICLGLLSIAQDLGLTWRLHMQTDATAAIGICRRRGLGKIRHLATADLWVQDKLRCNAFTLLKIPGADNPADVLTKFVERPLMVKHLEALGLWPEAGRAESAPVIEHNVVAMLSGLSQMSSL